MLWNRKVESLTGSASLPVVPQQLSAKPLMSSFEGRDVKVVDEKDIELLRQFNNVNWNNKSSLYGSNRDLLCKSLTNSVKEKRQFGL